MKFAKVKAVSDYRHIAHLQPTYGSNVLKVMNGVQFHQTSRPDNGVQHVLVIVMIPLITRHSWMKSAKVKAGRDYQHIAQLQPRYGSNVLKGMNGM